MYRVSHEPGLLLDLHRRFRLAEQPECAIRSAFRVTEQIGQRGFERLRRTARRVAASEQRLKRRAGEIGERVAQLTTREKEVLQGIFEGKITKVIADELVVSHAETQG